MRWLLALHRWQPTEHFTELFIRNAAAVINNYFADGVNQAILSGGIFSQGHLDNLLVLVGFHCDVRYFWLEADDELRIKRVIARARDSGDTPESARELTSKYTFNSAPLRVQEGKYHTLVVGTRSPEEIVNEIISNLV